MFYEDQQLMLHHGKSASPVKKNRKWSFGVKQRKKNLQCPLSSDLKIFFQSKMTRRKITQLEQPLDGIRSAKTDLIIREIFYGDKNA